MLKKLLNIGLSESIGFEESIRIKFLNAANILFSAILYFFIIFHIAVSKKYDTALVQFIAAISLAFVFWLQKTKRHNTARFIFFLLLHITIFSESMFLSPGRGNEYFHLIVIILLLIQVKNPFWVSLLVVLNVILFLLPQLIIAPYPVENYSLVTVLALCFATILSILFFIIIQKQYEKQLQVKNKSLAELNKEKNDLMSIVAHDLKTPLAQIEGLISILKLEGSQLNKEQLALIERIKSVTGNQRKQISSFLNINAIEDKNEESKLEQFNIINSIESVLNEMAPLASVKNIKIVEKYDSENISMLGNADNFIKIITNLISNAIKYSHPKSTIKINVTSDHKQLLILVIDEGQGFKKEELHQVFSKNTILSATPTAKETASGVGLFIVKKYVDLMSGWIWLESKEGVGTTFFIKLPR